MTEQTETPAPTEEEPAAGSNEPAQEAREEPKQEEPRKDDAPKNGTPAPTPLVPVPFEPQNTSEMYRLAKYFASADIIPKELRRKPYDVLLVLMKGRELGLQPLQALGNIHIVEGKAEVGAHLITAMVLRSGKAEYFRCVEQGYDDNGEGFAVYETRRKGWPAGQVSSVRWDRQRAKKAKLWGKGGDKAAYNNWQKHELEMCKRRASAELGRDEYPDIVMGLYDFGELVDQVAREEVDMGPAVVVNGPEDATEKASSLKDRMREKAEAGRAHARGDATDDKLRERIKADPQAEGPGTMPVPPRDPEGTVDAELVEEETAEEEPADAEPDWMKTPEAAAPEASTETEEEEVAEVVPLNGGDMTTEEKAEALADERAQAELDLDGEDDR